MQAETIVILLVLAIIPATIATRKGRSWIGYYLFGLLLFLPALVVSVVISPLVIRIGDTVKVIDAVRLDGGERIRRGWTSKVVDTDVIDGVPVVLINGPAGTTHWVAKRTLRVA